MPDTDAPSHQVSSMDDGTNNADRGQPPSQPSVAHMSTNYGTNPSGYGQPQPMAQYSNGYMGQPQQMPQATTYQPPTRPPQKKAWSITKDIIHSFIIIIAIACLGVALSTISYGDASIAAMSAAPVSAVAILWSSAELITRCARKFKAGIHPGAHVGVCLFLWLAAAILSGLLGTFAGIYSSGSYGCYDYGYGYGYGYDCYDNFYGKRPEFIAVVALIAIIWLGEFILFIGACIDTHKRNTFRSKQMIFVPAPYFGGPAAQGWQPLATQQNYGQPQMGYAPQMQQQQPQQAQAVNTQPYPQQQERYSTYQQSYPPYQQEAGTGLAPQQRELQRKEVQHKEPSLLTENSEDPHAKGKGIHHPPAAYTGHGNGEGGSRQDPEVAEYYTPSETPGARY